MIINDSQRQIVIELVVIAIGIVITGAYPIIGMIILVSGGYALGVSSTMFYIHERQRMNFTHLHDTKTENTK